MNLDNIKKWLIDLGEGARVAFGEATASVPVSDHPRGWGGLAAVRSGYELRELPGPEEVVRRHQFDDLVALSDWLKRHAKPDWTEILVDKTGGVVALLGASFVPAGDTVTCKLSTHPRAARWLSLFGRPITQRQFHRAVVSALEDFAPVRGSNGADLGSYGSVLAGNLMKIEVAKAGNFTAVLDELGNTRLVAADEKREISAKIPPAFAIEIPLFLGADPKAVYEIEVQVSADAENGKVTFELSAPALEVVRHKAVGDAVTFLRAQLGDGWLVGLGTPSLALVQSRKA